MRSMWFVIFTLICWHVADSHAIDITGTYKLIKSENFDEYMKAIGVGWALRQAAKLSSYSTEISRNGDEWNIKTITTFKITDITFKLGEEFDETTGDGHESKSTITLEGDNVLVHIQKRKDRTLKIIREFTDDEMKMTLTAGNIVCTRIYKKQE